MELSKEKSDLIASSNIERVLAATGVLGAAAGAFFVSYLNPATAGFFPQCPLYTMFGLHCPGCGLTRGFHALFHGDVLTAIDYNALIPIYVFVVGYLLISMILIAARGRGLSWKVFPPAAIYGFLVVSLVFAILRNLPVYPFNLLAP